jgi:putative nucleotidyltransferase with HDIG domain
LLGTLLVQPAKNSPVIRPPWAHLRIPPFPQVAMRVMQLAGNADVSMRQLSDLVSTDPAFSSEVLTIANSALFGSRVPIRSVLQAVATLGTNSLKGVCLTVGVRAYLGKTLNHASVRAIWRHSLACGLIAEQLAGACNINKNTAYTAGVLHDIGRMALTVLMPQDYPNLLASLTGTATSVLTPERDLCGFDHCEAGLQLISDWNLPVEFRAVVADHHTPAQEQTTWRLPDLVRISCRVADTMGFAVCPRCTIDTWPELLAASTELEKQVLPVDVETFSFDILSKINAVEVAT